MARKTRKKRTKTPKSVQKAITDAKRKQARVLSEMVRKIGVIMSPKKRSHKRKKTTTKKRK